MAKPAGITASAILMAVLVLLDVAVSVLAPATPPVLPHSSPTDALMRHGAVVAGTLFASIVSLVVLFFYWKGHNWARWLVMIYSVISLLGLVLITHTFASSVPAGAIQVAKAVLALVLLWYLNTAPVRAWFTRKPITA